MAQVQQKAASPQGKSAVSSTAGSEQPTSGFRFPFRLSSLRPRPLDDSKPQSPWRRLLIGIVVLMVGLTVIQLLIGVVYTRLPRSAQDALQQPLGSKNTFILGGLNGVNLILIVLFGALYIALIRYNVIPRSAFNSAANARAQARGGSTSAGARNTRSAVSTVNLNPQTRASRRQAATAAALAEANAKNSKNGRKNAKAPAPLMKAKAPAPAMKSKAGQSGATTVTTVTATRAKSEPVGARSGTFDAEYERVKALQRQQRRREAKR